jgi:hypothetical protein
MKIYNKTLSKMTYIDADLYKDDNRIGILWGAGWTGGVYQFNTTNINEALADMVTRLLDKYKDAVISERDSDYQYKSAAEIKRLIDAIQYQELF